MMSRLLEKLNKNVHYQTTFQDVLEEDCEEHRVHDVLQHQYLFRQVLRPPDHCQQRLVKH